MRKAWKHERAWGWVRGVGRDSIPIWGKHGGAAARDEAGENQFVISFVCSAEQFRLYLYASWKGGSYGNNNTETDKNHLIDDLCL